MKIWGFSSFGRASALQAEGDRFKSCNLQMIFEGYIFVEKYPEKLPETWTCDNAKEKLVEKEKEKCFGI